MKKKRSKPLNKFNPFVIGLVNHNGETYNVRNTIKRSNHKVTENKELYENNPIHQHKNWVLMKVDDKNTCLWMELA